jgi:hypothetical protein
MLNAGVNWYNCYEVYFGKDKIMRYDGTMALPRNCSAMTQNQMMTVDGGKVTKGTKHDAVVAQEKFSSDPGIKKAQQVVLNWIIDLAKVLVGKKLS